METTKRYQRACVEVLEVLKLLKPEEFNRIPKERITLYQKNQASDYTLEIDEHQKLTTQISDDAKLILANLFVRFIASDKDQKKIYEREKKAYVQREMRRIAKEKEKELQQEGLSQVQTKEMQHQNLPIEAKPQTFLEKWIDKVKKILKIG